MNKLTVAGLALIAVGVVGFLQTEMEIVHDETRAVSGRIQMLEEDMEQMQVDIAEIKSFIIQSKERLRYTEADKECLAKNIFHEAGIEPVEGKFAVAQVTLNRLREGRWGDSICDVVYARAQFSWTLKPRLVNQQPRGILWEESRMVAKRVLVNGYRVPSLATSNHYHADYVDPLWRKSMTRIKKIGQHIFYKD
jgi:spore germination cell wall hydrolase CwlJ-like protein